MVNRFTGEFHDMWYRIANFIPNILGAILLLVVAWLVATLIQAIFTKGLKKIGASRAMTRAHMATDDRDAYNKLNSIGKILYYLVFILFLPSVLDQLRMNSVANPISNMMDKTLDFLPNLFMAAIILVIGYFVAKFVRNIVSMILGTINIDKWFNKLTKRGNGEVMSPDSKTTLTNVLSNVVFILILIPIVTVALETLGIDSITRPVTAMLNEVLNMIPNIFVAIILILIGIVLARFIGELLSNLLKGTGIDDVSNYLNQKQQSSMPSFDIATIIGKVVQVLIIIFFTVEGLNVLHLEVLQDIGMAVISYLPLLLSALVIILLGFIGSTLLGNYIRQATGNRLFGGIVKYAILIMTIFMALSQLHFGTSIVNLAFLFVIAGLSVAFALSFGLGGREFASRQLQKFEAKMEKESKNSKDE